MTTGQLRVLFKRGYLSHAREVTTPQDADRRFEAPSVNGTFHRNTCFVLSKAGQARFCPDLSEPDHAVVEMPLAVSVDEAGFSAESRVAVPSPELPRHESRQGMRASWDTASRTLFLGERVIKHFAVPAASQEAVLEAFQEEGWPTSIDDPLSPVPDQQPKARLRNTIKSLNRNQLTDVIRFRGDGTGQRVGWEILSESAFGIDSSTEQPLGRAA